MNRLELVLGTIFPDQVLHDRHGTAFVATTKDRLYDRQP